MTIRRQSKVPYSRKGWGTLFASGMEQTAMPSRSRVGFGVIGARNASVRLAGGLACGAPCGRHQPRLIAGHGPTPTFAGGGKEAARLGSPVAIAASSMPVSTHAAPTGADVGKGRVARSQGAPGSVGNAAIHAATIHNAQNHAQAWA